MAAAVILFMTFTKKDRKNESVFLTKNAGLHVYKCQNSSLRVKMSREYYPTPVIGRFL